MSFEHLAKEDSAIHQIIQKEMERQRDVIGLIASENLASEAVLEAMGSVLTNKYAEGYPSARYYGGCEFVDDAESIAIERAKKLFGADHVNVQPHSGTQANLAAILSVLKPGQTILSMNLNHGGHLSHGHHLNLIGRLFNIVPYGVEKESGRIDYDKLEAQALEVKPALLIAGASAYPRVIDFERVGAIAKKAGAVFLADIAHIAGLVAAGLHPNPVPHADFVTSTTHKTLRGPRGGLIMCKEQFAKELDTSLFPGNQGGPLMHVIAAKAVCFGEALKPNFKTYQQQVLKNAKTLAEGLKGKGYEIVSGGTDNHLCLVKVTDKVSSGKAAENRLGKNNIVVNKNLIPFDTESAFKASGIRIGAPITTSRGMKENEMKKIVDWMDRTLSADPKDPEQDQVRDEVISFSRQWPIFPVA